jgi:protoporphyrinogen oxidase
MKDSKIQRTAIIIGAGPAGLTAAWELLRHTDILPIVIEQDYQVGGISKTINYKGNRIDIGGHRFFSQSDRILTWWLDFLPLLKTSDSLPAWLHYHGKSHSLPNHKREISFEPNAYMLIRPRKSRILFRGELMDYPLKIDTKFIKTLGYIELLRIMISYLSSFALLGKIKTLEDFYIKRFGRRLYNIFFKEYSEKVWGKPCSELSAEWGAQRVKSLSIRKTILHSMYKLLGIRMNKTETSLIEQFLYPQLGPGQLWETVAQKIVAYGGQILTRHKATHLYHNNNNISTIRITNMDNTLERILSADYVLSTMPIKHLAKGLSPLPPEEILLIGNMLPYRDFITVGVLCKSLSLSRPLDDQWIYIQDTGVAVGRIQIFNNWSPDMVADSNTWWLGLEYFCNKGDKIWELTDHELAEMARKELSQIKICTQQDVLDTFVVRMPKAYPVYSGSYEKFRQIRNYLDKFENLFAIGRNGMHRYNNQDHSMLAAMEAVAQIRSGTLDRERLWSINTEENYHESKS